MALVCPSCGDSLQEGIFCPKDGARLGEEDDRSKHSRVGQTIADRYRLTRKVGEGAAGEVYEAEHLHIHKRVALKLLRRQVGSDPTVVQRFQREARTTSAIRHPNIVQIEDFGIATDGTVFLAMEWLDGETLESLMNRELLAPTMALHIASAICLGLSAAHEAGVIHRDLKPANVIVSRDTQETVIKVLDFGIAKLSSDDSNLTRDGTFLGTPNYMAPEQALGGDVDGRADVYSLGVVLYQMFTGRLPFIAPTPVGVLHKHAHEKPEPPAEVVKALGGHISPDIDSIIMRCLEKNPIDRFDSASALGAAIQEVSTGILRAPGAPPLQTSQPESHESSDFHEFQRRSPWLFVAATVLLLGLGGAGFLLIRSDSKASVAAIDAAPPDRLVRTQQDAASTPTPMDPPTDASQILPRPPDAGSRTNPDDEQPSDSWSYTWKDARGEYTVVVTPGKSPPSDSQQVQLKLRFKKALTTSATASISFSHYLGHNSRGASTHVLDMSGSLVFQGNFESPGKYHAALVVSSGGEELLKTKFDICVGAPPGGTSKELSKICPRMNQRRGRH